MILLKEDDDRDLFKNSHTIYCSCVPQEQKEYSNQIIQSTKQEHCRTMSEFKSVTRFLGRHLWLYVTVLIRHTSWVSSPTEHTSFGPASAILTKLQVVPCSDLCSFLSPPRWAASARDHRRRGMRVVVEPPLRNKRVRVSEVERDGDADPRRHPLRADVEPSERDDACDADGDGRVGTKSFLQACVEILQPAQALEHEVLAIAEAGAYLTN